MDRSNPSSFSFEDLTQETFAARSNRKLWDRDPFDDFPESNAGPGVINDDFSGPSRLHSRSSRLPGSRLPDPPQWDQDTSSPLATESLPRRRVRSPRSVQDEVKYLPPPRSRGKASSTQKSWSSQLGPWPWRFGWAMVVVMMVRLVFSDGGLVDFHRKQKILSARTLEYQSIKAENKMIKDEIYRIRNVSRVQKELARTHLGLISADEYLVMFAEEAQAPASEVAHQD